MYASDLFNYFIGVHLHLSMVGGRTRSVELIGIHTARSTALHSVDYAKFPLQIK